MTQQPLIPVPDHHSGIWSRLLDNNRCIDAAAWKHHLETKQYVGKCRRDQQPLNAGDPYTVGYVTWYPAMCSSPNCDYETAAHGPRPEKPKKGAA